MNPSTLLKSLLSTALKILSGIPPEVLEKTLVDFLEAIIAKVGKDSPLVKKMRDTLSTKE